MFNRKGTYRRPAESTTRVVTFFALTFAVTWTLWLAAATLSGGTLSPPSGLAITSNALFLLGVFGPALVALVTAALEGGRGAASELIRGIARWPSKARWYVFAIAYFAVIKVAAAALHRAVTGTWPSFGETPWYLMVGGIIVSTPVQAGEEIGWRAYALPRLAARIGLGPASILLGAIWALWHLPLFLIPGTTTSGQSFPAYLAAVAALSVAITWLYWRTEGSLFATMLMHAAVNNTRDIFPSTPSTTHDPFAFTASPQAWLTAVVLWSCAVYFLARMRAVRSVQGLPS